MSESSSIVRSFLAREENVLVLVGSFPTLSEEIELHSLGHGLAYDPFVRQLLADGMMALALHLSSRPIDEYIGWTISLQEPMMNLFFTGSSRDEALVGRAFLDEEQVRPRDHNLLVVQSRRPSSEPHESFVEVSGIDVFAMVEHYYRQSEQRNGRFLTRDQGDVMLLHDLPDADLSWLREVDYDEIAKRLEDKRLQFLAERRFRFACGCNRERMMGVLKSTYGTDFQSLFEGQDRIEMQCQRCAARLEITEAEYQAFCAE
ncbi:MAG: Hsp33 family molecular chaperone HslO [Planctomycetota bacterium]